jgi:hypothetical protein
MTHSPLAWTVSPPVLAWSSTNSISILRCVTAPVAPSSTDDSTETARVAIAAAVYR